MDKKTEKEYQNEIIKASLMLGEAFKAGKEAERKEWIEHVPPENLLLTIRARDKADQLDQIRIVVPFSSMRLGRTDLIENIVRDTLYKIFTQGRTLKDLCSSPYTPVAGGDA